MHLKGTFAPTHHAVEPLAELSKAGEDVSSGRVINTTSGAGLVGNFGQANYTAAKAGIAAFTLTVSLERLQDGRHRQLHRPGRRHPHGGVDPRRRHRGQGARRVRRVEPAWTRRNSSPVVAWLASDEAGHVTGQVIRAVGDEIVHMKGWSNAVDGDADLVELEAHRLGEGGDARLGRGVVGLAEVADQAGARRGVDDPAGTDTSSPALSSDRQWLTAWWVGAKVPFRCTRMTESQSCSVIVPDRGVAGDAGVVDEDVEPAEVVDGLLRPWRPAPSKSATSS